MVSALLLILSAILIGTGVSLIVRDMRARRRGLGLEQEERPPGRTAGTTVAANSRSHPGSLPRDLAGQAAALPELSTSLLRAITGEPRTGAGDQDNLGDGRPSLAEEWRAVQPMLHSAVERVNVLLAPQQLALGQASAADWNYRRHGYGAYHRVLLRGDSVAWLRLELTNTARLHAALKAHSDDRASINRSAECALADLDAVRAADLLLDCLRSAAGSPALPAERLRREAPQSAQLQRATGIVGSALRATNGAFAQAGARIVPLAPEALEEAHPRRMTLRVEVDGSDVARMHIERLHDAMEVAVGARNMQLVALERRRRLPLEGMTIHALAELIAGCAWPAIAHFRDDRRP
jgi:hypothetical protein